MTASIRAVKFTLYGTIIGIVGREKKLFFTSTINETMASRSRFFTNTNKFIDHVMPTFRVLSRTVEIQRSITNNLDDSTPMLEQL